MAACLLAAGNEVRVWNQSAVKADASGNRAANVGCRWKRRFLRNSRIALDEGHGADGNAIVAKYVEAQSESLAGD